MGFSKKYTKKTKDILGRLEKIYPTTPLEKREYEQGIFLIELPEGGSEKDLKINHFSGFAVFGDINPHNPIRFYAKVVGFEDINAPTRNWGYTLEDFRKNNKYLINLKRIIKYFKQK